MPAGSVLAALALVVTAPAAAHAFAIVQDVAESRLAAGLLRGRRKA